MIKSPGKKKWRQNRVEVRILRAKQAAKITEVVDLNFCSLDPGVINQIAQFPLLQELSIVQCSIVDADLKIIARIHNLSVLILNKNKFSAKRIRYLRSLRNLSTLLIEKSQLCSQCAHHISKMQSLRCLSLAESVIGFEGAISISKLTNLRKLELCNNYLYGIGVYKIGGLPKCKSLNFEPRGKQIDQTSIIPEFTLKINLMRIRNRS